MKSAVVVGGVGILWFDWIFNQPCRPTATRRLNDVSPATTTLSNHRSRHRSEDGMRRRASLANSCWLFGVCPNRNGRRNCMVRFRVTMSGELFVRFSCLVAWQSSSFQLYCGYWLRGGSRSRENDGRDEDMYKLWIIIVLSGNWESDPLLCEFDSKLKFISISYI